MRLQLFVSHSGLCSRRDALGLVQSGQIKVNGSIVEEPSHQVGPGKDKIYFKNKQLLLKENTYIIINKPKNTTTTKEDRFAKVTIMDLLPQQYRHLNPVGRLDRDTTGILILTNDGDLIHKITHPAFHINKVYLADLDKSLNNSHKSQLQNGVFLEDKKTLPCKINNLGERRVKIIMQEGRKRQIKEMFRLFGYHVKSLKRVSIGDLGLGSLPEGKWRPLSNIEIQKLKNATKKYKRHAS